MIRSGTRVFFIQKAPVVGPGKTKSIPSFGARLRCMSPVARASPSRASSGVNVTPSSRSVARMTPSDAAAGVPTTTAARTSAAMRIGVTQRG
jgi:hypothetical protein